MKQTITTENKTTQYSPISFFSEKKIYFLIVILFLLFLTVNLFAQTTTIFSENMGTTGSSPDTLAIHTFQNPALTFSGSADVRTTIPSSGYIGASGLFNAFLQAAGGYYFEISGINTCELSNLILSFGIFKSTNASDGSDFKVSVSTNGINYSNLSLLLLPTGSGTSIWYYQTASGNIPSCPNLRIRFTNITITTINQYRIDDVKLTGVPNPFTATLSPAGGATICSGDSVVLTANSGSGYTYQWRKDGIDISGATNISYAAKLAGVHSVVITLPGGCSKESNSFTLSLNPKPSTIIHANGPTSFCVGDSVILTAPAGSGYLYQWSLDNINIAGANSINYTAKTGGAHRIEVTNSFNCKSKSGSKAIYVYDIPVPTIYYSCEANLIYATSGNGYKYQWKLNGNNLTGDTNSVIAPTVSGNYSYSVINGVCAASSATKSTPISISSTQVTSSYRNKFFGLLGDKIKASLVSGAKAYSFQYRDTSNTGPFSYSFGDSLATTFLQNAIPALQYNHAYNVRVRAIIAGDIGCFSTTWKIFTVDQAAPPSTKLNGTWCGKTNVLHTDTITCLSVPAADQYTFRFINPTNGTVVSTKTSTANTLVLSAVTPPLSNSTSYNVAVSVRRDNIIKNSGAGDTCLITTANSYRKSLADQTVIDEIKVYPNPFSNTTNFYFKLNKNSDVRIIIYDVSGRIIKTILSEKIEKGEYKISLDGTAFESGIYFTTFEIEGLPLKVIRLNILKE